MISERSISTIHLAEFEGTIKSRELKLLAISWILKTVVNIFYYRNKIYLIENDKGKGEREGWGEQKIEQVDSCLIFETRFVEVDVLLGGYLSSMFFHLARLCVMYINIHVHIYIYTYVHIHI